MTGCQGNEKRASIENTIPPVPSSVPSNHPSSIPLPTTNESNTPEVVSGGDIKAELLTEYQFEFYGVPTFINEIVGTDKVSEWLKQFKSNQNPEGRDSQEITIANVIMELQVPKEDFIKASQGLLFSEEQMDALYSGDKKRMNAAFVNENALLVNGNIYTADWLSAHSVDDYKTEGITDDILYPYLKKMNKEVLQDEYNNIHKKVSEAQFSLSKTDVLNVSGATYSLEWLTTHIVQDYEKAGITAAMLEQYVNRVHLNEQSPEFEHLHAILGKLKE
ncbi:hypothetical protein [Gorillibacterium timonense]|uniref:hypothetical protein n=1 Tax=Gorillibacterium timonense TaxID=1689269 RepID=UPI0011DE4B62|nr:hypothetical protein [Gorillibacterium timonense]